MGKQETLDTIWEVPDELWDRVEAIILEEDPPKARGRKRADARQMLNGIIFRLRSGCQWNRLPRELGDDSTIHRTFQRWVERGVLGRMWGALEVRTKTSVGESDYGGDTEVVRINDPLCPSTMALHLAVGMPAREKSAGR